MKTLTEQFLDTIEGYWRAPAPSRASSGGKRPATRPGPEPAPLADARHRDRILAFIRRQEQPRG